MADVSGDRGQLLTVVAVVLAVALVTLAMVANTVIFTENLATRETTQSIEKTGDYQEATKVSLSTALNRINDNAGADHGEMFENFSRAVQTQERILQRDAATGGASIDLSIHSSTNGTRLSHTDPSRPFTSGGSSPGNADWTLAREVSDTRRFKLNVSRQELIPATVDTPLLLFNDAFHVRIDNGSSEWKTYFFHGVLTGTIYVFTDEPGASLPVGDALLNLLDDACGYDSPEVQVDFVEGTVNGHDCDELSYYPDVGGEYDISYRNVERSLDSSDLLGVPGLIGLDTSRATGTYDIRVDDADVQTSNFYDPTQSPFASASITATDVMMEYRTPELSYLARLGVEPDSSTPAGSSPTTGTRPSVTIDSVVDDTDPGLLGLLPDVYNFTVSASVSDPDGNLDQIRVILTDEDGFEVENNTKPVTGSTASVHHQFQSKDLLSLFEDDGNFTIQVAATDTEGLSASAAETHKADDDGTVGSGEVYPSMAGPRTDSRVVSTGVTAPAVRHVRGT